MATSSYQYYAGGQWRDAEGKALFDVFQPYDGEIFARVPAANRTLYGLTSHPP
jgi:acyl-CoA reductase-like NAD-dependent aldehyde dehydrogenase